MMRIFSSSFRIHPSTIIAVPVIGSLYRLFDQHVLKSNADQKPIKYIKIGKGSYPVVTISPKDAERLAEENMARKFREAAIAAKAIEDAKKELK